MEVLNYPFDGAYLMKKKKSIKRELLSDGETRVRKKIAVLGGSTTDDIAALLELFLLHHEIEPTFYMSEYGRYWEEAMFGGEGLAEFSPDIVYVHTTSRNLTFPPLDLNETAAEVNARLEKQFSHFQLMWDALGKLGCTVIQNNFEPPCYRVLGNKDAADFHGRTWFINAMNQRLYEHAEGRGNFFVHDINYLAAAFGLEKWHDLSAWYLYKYALPTAAIPEFAHNLANIIKSVSGKNKKALVLDLDNTLWGGVISEDGISGLEIGHETAAGSAFLEFQQYIAQVKNLGIPLNVCSKNDSEAALLGLNHPENVLKPEDFLIIKANWENKDKNIAEIAEKLNILPESVVFADDNPAERALVRASMPKTAVPEMNAPETYIKTLDRSGFFESTFISADDIERNRMYKANLSRDELTGQFADYDEYLKTLGMTAVIRPFEPIYLERITQLTNKSNQFNLTTKRYTLRELSDIAADGNFVTLYGKLSDKFGDNGIVSVAVGEVIHGALHVELLLMSCRVLKRNMEYAMLDALVAAAKGRGVTKIFGYYYASGKNAMVSNLYADFGFTKVHDGGADTKWELNVSEYENKNNVIAVKNPKSTPA